jgi:uncharacterized membrane protein SirB2
MSYLAIKAIHITCVAASGSFFLLRGIWMWRDAALLQRPWVKIAPHLIDTLLLASAVLLAVMSGQYPIAQAWLSAKVLALLLYIVLGAIALKRGKTKTVRITAFIAALVVFAYIVSVAVSKHVMPLG